MACPNCGKTRIHDYAQEKMRTAACMLASGSSPLNERLRNALWEFSPLDEDRLPEHLRPVYSEIRAALTEDTINETANPEEIATKITRMAMELCDHAIRCHSCEKYRVYKQEIPR